MLRRGEVRDEPNNSRCPCLLTAADVIARIRVPRLICVMLVLVFVGFCFWLLIAKTFASVIGVLRNSDSLLTLLSSKADDVRILLDESVLGDTVDWDAVIEQMVSHARCSEHPPSVRAQSRLQPSLALRKLSPAAPLPVRKMSRASSLRPCPRPTYRPAASRCPHAREMTTEESIESMIWSVIKVVRVSLGNFFLVFLMFMCATRLGPACYALEAGPHGALRAALAMRDAGLALRCVPVLAACVALTGVPLRRPQVPHARWRHALPVDAQEPAQVRAGRRD